MVQMTGPAVVILLAIGYFGVNAIAERIEGLFKRNRTAVKTDKE